MKAVVLTGHTRGLGKAIHDVLIQRSDENQVLIFLGRESSKTVNQTVHYLYCDLDSFDNFNLIELQRCFDRVDDITFINNAGLVTPISSLRNLDVEEFEKAINVNFFSPIKLVTILNQNCINLNVINISSGAAKKAIPFWGAYCSTKAAVNSFLDVCSLEAGIECENFDPGVIDTDMQKLIRKRAEHCDELAGFTDLYNSGMLQDANEVAVKICALIQ